jgi:hypothetical protein
MVGSRVAGVMWEGQVEVIMQILNTLLVRHQQNQLQENCSFTQP